MRQPILDGNRIRLGGNSNDEARLRLRKSHLTRSLERFVQRGMFRIQLGPFNSVDHHLSRIDRSGAALGRRRQPVIMLSRHQYELASAVARDLDRLALSLMLMTVGSGYVTKKR